MKLSAPMYRLKRQARQLARKMGVPLTQALDAIAKNEGFPRWNLLAATAAARRPAAILLTRLSPGDLVLLGARPGHGKTLLALELLLEGARVGRRGVFYTLEYSQREVTESLETLGADTKSLDGKLSIVTSDEISANFIREDLRETPRGTVVVIDYLQLLDQDRKKPELEAQVAELERFAESSGSVVVCLSQIDRSYNPETGALPDLNDVRLPNPLDLRRFSKVCFLHDGEVRLEAIN